MEITVKFEIVDFPYREFLITFYESTHIDFYLVGGLVRDILLKRSIKDIDLAAETIDYRDFAKKLNERLKGTFVEFKDNVRIVKGNVTFDISKLRGNTITEDLNHRDFTINNLAYHFKKGVIGNISDIENKIIRIVYEDAFTDDPLRILRGFRFMSELNFTIEKHTLEKMIAQQHLLKNTPSERINKELTELLLGINGFEAVKLMADSGILLTLIPELMPLKGRYGGTYHVEDVLSHTLTVVKYIYQSIPKYNNDTDRLALVLSALFHDIGKGDVAYEHSNGKFVGHEEKSSLLTAQILKRLSFPNKLLKEVSHLVAKHGKIRIYATNGVKERTLLRFVYDNYPLLDKLIDLSIADAKSKERDNEIFYKTINKIKEAASKLDFSRKSLIGGVDLIKLGFEKGEKMGELLNEVHFLLIAGILKDRDEAIKYVKSFLNNQ